MYKDFCTACVCVGGRILCGRHWPDTGPLDLGAELVHGEKSVVTKIAKTNGYKLEEVSACEYGNCFLPRHC